MFSYILNSTPEYIQEPGCLLARRGVRRCRGDSVATERVAEASTKIIFESCVAGGVDNRIDATIDIDSNNWRAIQGAIPIYKDIKHLRG